MHACFVHCSSQYYLNLIWKSSFNPSQLLIISPLNSLYCLMYIEEQHGWLFHWVKMVKIKGHLRFEGGKFTIWYSELPCSTLLDCKVNSCNPYTSLFVEIIVLQQDIYNVYTIYLLTLTIYYHTQIHLDIHMHSELNAFVILGLIDIIPDSVQPSPVIFCGLDNLCFVLSSFLWPQYIMIRWKANKW